MRNLLMSIVLIAPLAACQNQAPAPPPEPAAVAPAATPDPAPAPAASTLKTVDSKYVCMVNNTVFPNPQIPVAVGDKTYYGCCAMCEKTLSTDAKSREAIDPVTGAVVDKAAATILAMPDGTVRYFASLDSAQKFHDSQR